MSNVAIRNNIIMFLKGISEHYQMDILLVGVIHIPDFK